jgi:opacity protein-like surface antigen
MRRVTTATVLLALSIAGSASAQTPGVHGPSTDFRHFAQAFGGVRLGTVAAADPAFGAVFGGNLTPNILAVGEAGHLRDVLPNTIDTLLAFSPVDFHLSAWYAQGGVRWTTASRSAIQPYVETSAGFARLQNSLGAVGSPLANSLVAVGFRLLDRTEPMATIGGGLAFQAGPLLADVGYRYRRIFTSNLFDAAIIGDRLDTNEVRVGIGVRF